MLKVFLLSSSSLLNASSSYFLYLEVKRTARLRGKEQELNDFWYFRFIVQVIYAHETVFFVHNNLNVKKGGKKIVSE